MTNRAEKFPRPWVSNGCVNRAGSAIRNGSLTPEDASTLDHWRAAHNKVLNNFQTQIRRRARGFGIDVAQRLKRRYTIVDKLFREPSMQLARMDDVAGCRMIFPDIKSLYEFRSDFHRARFRHRRKNDLDKYDYIKSPKASGYRSVHDIYAYDARSPRGGVYNGLMIELQYRTRCQHAWATASELAADATGSELKFGRGDPDDAKYFRVASEILARVHEDRQSCYPNASSAELIDLLSALEEKRKMRALFFSFHIFDGIPPETKCMILQKEAGILTIHACQNDDEATELYFELERGDLFTEGASSQDVVLIKSDTFAQARAAYMNYFSDAREFLKYLDSGCEQLRGMN